MAGIIDLSDKLARAKTQRTQEKLEAARKVFMCIGCPSRCAKCGAQIESDHNCCVGVKDFVFRFCPECSEEYSEYRLRKEGKQSREMYWHNEQWMLLWDAWIGYQESLVEYRKSKEFSQLLEDLKS